MTLSLDAFESSSQDWLVHLIPRRQMSRQEYQAFVAANLELRIERTAEGEVTVMPPPIAARAIKTPSCAANYATGRGKMVKALPLTPPPDSTCPMERTGPQTPHGS
jgi:hypothetical protein